MKIFSAQLLFEINIEGGSETQFHEEMHLLESESEPAALDLAFAKGKAETESFVNSGGRVVRWGFIGVTELKKLKFENGTAHLHNRTLEPENPEGYRKAALEKTKTPEHPYLYRFTYLSSDGA